VDFGQTAEDRLLFRKVMGRFATGITVITTELGGKIHGMTANAFMAGSLDPPLCIVSVRCTAQMHARLLETGKFGVSFLNEQQQHLSNHFAGRQFEGLEPDFVELNGVPVLNRAVAALAAETASRADCGDHTLFIGRITRMDLGAANPLLFYGGRYAFLDPMHGVQDFEAPAFW
jgi:flavin reductase (DIM6/NTAB) family NADH-FMN oxidoreductase RutF